MLNKFHETFTVPVPLDTQTKWNQGIAFELDHHSGWIKGDPKYIPAGKWFEDERKHKLQGIPVEPIHSWMCDILIANNISTKIGLDHGAGPFTNLGNRFTCPGGIDAHVISVDPLAPAYHKILNKHNIFNTLRPSFCHSEKLSECFEFDTFDFSVIINALDHSDDAVLALQNAVHVTRVGGAVCLITAKNEARHMEGKGFHQWNFFVEEEMLIFEDTRTKKNFNISNLLKRFTILTFEHDPNDEFGILRVCWLKMFQLQDQNFALRHV